jgi:hypothetical protein
LPPSCADDARLGKLVKQLNLRTVTLSGAGMPETGSGRG